MNSLVKASEFFDQMRAANQSFRLLNANIGSEETLLKGTFSRTRIREGLSVHYSDVVNLRELRTETEAPPHLGIKLFFQGGVSASIGSLDIPMPLRQEGGGWTPSAILFHQKETELFRRRAQAGDRVRKLTIKILPEWLESGDVFGDASADGLRRFIAQGLVARSWTPSRSLLALAQQVIRPPAIQPHLMRLYVESRVLGIIGEAFSLLVGAGSGAGSPATLTAAELKRLRQAEELLQAITEMPSLQMMATELGVSVNTLQRLFHAGHGTSVYNYVRTQKMEQARLAIETGELTIAQAAYLAGYTSAANFSTAFKRRYGFTPRQSRG